MKDWATVDKVPTLMYLPNTKQPPAKRRVG